MPKAIGFLAALACVGVAPLAGAQTPGAPSPKAPLRVTVVEVVPGAHALAEALADVLAERSDLGVLVDVDRARGWFEPCATDETDRCFTRVCAKHKIDLVLRAWAAPSAGKLSVSIDFVQPHEHSLKTFEEMVADGARPEAVRACAVRAIEKVLGKPTSESPTSPPTALAPKEPASTSEATQPSPPVVLAPLEPDANPEVTPTSAPPPAPTPVFTAPAVIQAPSHVSRMRVASYVTAGAGAAALVVGVVEALNVGSKNSIINEHRDQATAGDPNARALVGDAYGSAKTASLVSGISFAVGGAVIAAGVVMFFLSPNETPKTVASIGFANGRPTLALAGSF